MRRTGIRRSSDISNRVAIRCRPQSGLPWGSVDSLVVNQADVPEIRLTNSPAERVCSERCQSPGASRYWRHAPIGKVRTCGAELRRWPRSKQGGRPISCSAAGCSLTCCPARAWSDRCRAALGHDRDAAAWPARGGRRCARGTRRGRPVPRLGRWRISAVRRVPDAGARGHADWHRGGRGRPVLESEKRACPGGDETKLTALVS